MAGHWPIIDVHPLIEAKNLLLYRYFQCGVSNFLLARYDLAFKDFEEALLYLRGNQAMCVHFDICNSAIEQFNQKLRANWT